MQTVPIRPEAAPFSRLIVWSVGTGPGQHVDVSLCGPSGPCGWHRRWDDADAPLLQPIYAWSKSDLRVFLLTVRYGAAAQTAIVVGIPKAAPPIVLGQIDGALLWFDAGRSVLAVVEDGDAPGRVECWRWKAAAGRLRPGSCVRSVD